MAFIDISTVKCGNQSGDISSRAAFINISALKRGVYSRAAFNRVNTVIKTTINVSLSKS